MSYQHFKGCFKDMSRKCLDIFKQNSRGFQEGFKEVSRVFHGNSKVVSIVKSVSKVFEGIFMKILMLYSHRSYPSRRRACLSV